QDAAITADDKREHILLQKRADLCRYLRCVFCNSRTVEKAGDGVRIGRVRQTRNSSRVASTEFLGDSPGTQRLRQSPYSRLVILTWRTQAKIGRSIENDNWFHETI